MPSPRNDMWELEEGVLERLFCTCDLWCYGEPEEGMYVQRDDWVVPRGTLIYLGGFEPVPEEEWDYVLTPFLTVPPSSPMNEAVNARRRRRRARRGRGSAEKRKGEGESKKKENNL